MSTLKVSNIQHENTSNGGITIDSSGHVSVDGQSLPSAGPLSNRNLIINGAMQVAQRGTTSTNNGYGTVDRFRLGISSGTVTQTQQSLTSGNPYDEGFRYFLRAANTTAGSDDAAEQREIRQYIEAQNLASSGWNYTSSTSHLTLSFWARSSVGGTYYVLNRSLDGTGQGYTFSYTLTAGTWTKVTRTIPGNSNITVNDDNGVGFQVRFLIDLGTDFTDSGHTLNTWAAFDDTSRCPDFSHDWAGTTDATFDVTGVQLEVGQVATPFEHRSFGDELLRCKRYFERRHVNDNGDTDGVFGYSNSLSTTSSNFILQFEVEKRANAAVSLDLDGGTLFQRTSTGNSVTTTQSITVSSTNTKYTRITLAGSDFTAGGIGQVRVGQSGSGNAFFNFDAEL